MDANGNASNVSFYGRALVVDKVAPLLQSLSPANADSAVAPDRDIVLTFNEAIRLGSGSLQLKTAAGSLLGSYQASSPELSVKGSALTLKPAAPLQAGMGYKLEWTSEAITDLAGNSLAASEPYGFITRPKQTAFFWKNPQLTPSDNHKKSAIDLGDAIAILKMIVGLPANSDGSPVSGAQAVAADFDQDRDVDLSDAIAVLKLIVDLPVSAKPSWAYFDPASLPASVQGTQLLNHSSWHPALSSQTSPPESVELVGVLTGDVNGSWTG